MLFKFCLLIAVVHLVDTPGVRYLNKDAQERKPDGVLKMYKNVKLCTCE
jgi:hypothetical protein